MVRVAVRVRLRVWDEVTVVSVLWVWVGVVVEEGRSHSLLSHHGFHCVCVCVTAAAAAAVKTRDLSAFGCFPLVGVVGMVVAVAVRKGYPPGSSILSPSLSAVYDIINGYNEVNCTLLSSRLVGLKKVGGIGSFRFKEWMAVSEVGARAV